MTSTNLEVGNNLKHCVQNSIWSNLSKFEMPKSEPHSMVPGPTLAVDLGLETLFFFGKRWAILRSPGGSFWRRKWWSSMCVFWRNTRLLNKPLNVLINYVCWRNTCFLNRPLNVQYMGSSWWGALRSTIRCIVFSPVCIFYYFEGQNMGNFKHLL